MSLWETFNNWSIIKVLKLWLTFSKVRCKKPLSYFDLAGFYDQILWVHDHCFCCLYLTDSFSFFPLFFLFWRTTLHNVSRASFSHIRENRKKSTYEQKCATHLTAFYGCIATMLGSDTNLYPIDHRVFEPSNNQQRKHSICGLISCFIAQEVPVP